MRSVTLRVFSTRSPSKLLQKPIFTIGVALLLMSCERTAKPRENGSEASSTPTAGVRAPTPTSSSLIDSAHGAPAALVASPSGAADSAMDIEGLQCSPPVFSLKDTITLRMEYPHGEYLMVSQPDSTPFFLVYPDTTEPRNFFLVPADRFVTMPAIRFRADVKSLPRVYGRDTLETVFAKPGKYVVTIGHRLETEAASDVYKCTIRLVTNKQ